MDTFASIVLAICAGLGAGGVVWLRSRYTRIVRELSQSLADTEQALTWAREGATDTHPAASLGFIPGEDGVPCRDWPSAVPIPLCIANLQAGTILRRNSAFDAMMEVPESDEAPLVETFFHQYTPFLKDLDAGTVCEMTLSKQSGVALPARVHAKHASDGSNEVVILVEDATHDVEAHDQRELLATALEATEDGILIVETDGTVAHANRSAQELYGSKLVGETIGANHYFDEAGVNSAALLRSVLSEGTARQEALRICDDGSCRPTSLTLTRVDRNALPPVIVTIIRDLSAQQEMQDEVVRSNKLATLGELAGGVTHEIANPLSSVIENARYILECLEAKKTDQTVLEAAADTKLAAERMRSILEEVRRFTHMGQAGCERTTFGAAVASAIMLAGPAVRAHAHLVKPSHNGATIWGDPGHLTQVFLNLFKNAAEAMQDSGRSGTIWVELGEEEDRAFARIMDDGPGIPEAVRVRLFRDYITTKERGRGTGFGLKMCARLLEGDGGQIETEANDGGAIFVVWAPIYDRATLSSPGLRDSGPLGVPSSEPPTPTGMRAMTMPAPAALEVNDTVDLETRLSADAPERPRSAPTAPQRKRSNLFQKQDPAGIQRDTDPPPDEVDP